MALPNLTIEQRRAALAQAAHNRAARANLMARLGSGELTLADVLEHENEIVGPARVDRLLRALPGVGPATAKAVMQEIGVSESRRVRGLGVRQRASLLERFQPTAP